MKNDSYLHLSSLSFIEELEQGGLSYIDKRNISFVNIEYPNCNGHLVRELKKIHKWWLCSSDKLQNYKKKIISKIEPQKVERITQDKWLRFMILKTFHDSTISGIEFDKGKNMLTVNVEYDDAFCKTPFGKDVILMFYTEDFDTDFIENLSEVCEERTVQVRGIDHLFINGKSKFVIDYIYYENANFFNEKACSLKFICNNLEIIKRDGEKMDTITIAKKSKTAKDTMK